LYPNPSSGHGFVENNDNNEQGRRFHNRQVNHAWDAENITEQPLMQRMTVQRQNRPKTRRLRGAQTGKSLIVGPPRRPVCASPRINFAGDDWPPNLIQQLASAPATTI
jgi:hypothetical protein